MAKKTSYLPWIIGGVAAWFLFLKPKSIQGIGAIEDLIPKVRDYVDGFGKYTKEIIEVDMDNKLFKVHNDYGSSDWHKWTALKSINYRKNGVSEWTRNYKG